MAEPPIDDSQNNELQSPQEEKQSELQTPAAVEDLKETIKQQVLSEARAENRKLFLQVTMGVLLGLGVGIGLSFYWDTIGELPNLLIVLMTVGITALAILLYYFLVFRGTILAKVFGVAKASQEDIFSTLYTPTKGLIKENVSDQQYEKKVGPYLEAFEKGGRQVLAYMAYRRTRRMLFGLFISLVIGLGGIVGTILLLRQNELLTFQNNLVIDQNNLLTTQNQLVEGQRRSSLIFMMSNIMDKVDEEIKNDYNKDGIRNLSDELIGRIVALNQSFRPYKYLDRDSLIERPVSPERGQLLTALIKSSLDSVTYLKIFNSSIFQFPDFRDVDLRNVSLKHARLIGANFARSILTNADLNGINLTDSDLTETFLVKANLQDAILINTDMKMSSLAGANLEDAVLIGANLHRAYIGGANLRDVNFRNANLQDVQGLTLRQLLTTSSLYNVNGLQDSIVQQILQQKPELLEDSEKRD